MVSTLPEEEEMPFQATRSLVVPAGTSKLWVAEDVPPVSRNPLKPQVYGTEGVVQ